MTIYKITNVVNSKVYVGRTVGKIEIRWHRHKLAALRGQDTYFYRAIRKHGANNFVVEAIDTASSLEELLALEAFHIKACRSMAPTGYNSTLVVDHHIYMTPELKLKIRRSKQGKRNSLQKNCKSKFIGVGKNNHCDTYYWTIRDGQKQIKRGAKTEIDAARAYDLAAIHLYGLDAKVNFSDSVNSYSEEKALTLLKRKVMHSYFYILKVNDQYTVIREEKDTQKTKTRLFKSLDREAAEQFLGRVKP